MGPVCNRCIGHSGIPHLLLNPWDSQVSFTINVVLDGNMEGQENIILDFPCRSLWEYYTSFNRTLQDIEEVSVEINNPEIGCPGKTSLTTEVSGGVPPLYFLWNDNSTQNSISISPTAT